MDEDNGVAVDLEHYVNPKTHVPHHLFAGACTTGVVAKKLGRSYVMIDANPDYCEMGEKRIAETEVEMVQEGQQLELF